MVHYNSRVQREQGEDWGLLASEVKSSLLAELKGLLVVQEQGVVLSLFLGGEHQVQCVLHGCPFGRVAACSSWRRELVCLGSSRLFIPKGALVSAVRMVSFQLAWAAVRIWTVK